MKLLGRNSLMRNRIKNKRLGEILIDRGFINREQLNEALSIQKNNGNNGGRRKFTGEILAELGFVDKEDVFQAFNHQYHFPYLPLDRYEPNLDAVNTISYEVARKYSLFPVDKFRNILTVAMSNPLDTYAVEDVKRITGCDVQIFISSPSDIIRRIELYSNGADKE